MCIYYIADWKMCTFAENILKYAFYTWNMQTVHNLSPHPTITHLSINVFWLKQCSKITNLKNYTFLSKSVLMWVSGAKGPTLFRQFTSFSSLLPISTLPFLSSFSLPISWLYHFNSLMSVLVYWWQSLWARVRFNTPLPQKYMGHAPWRLCKVCTKI